MSGRGKKENDKKKIDITGDLSKMMYGFGDVKNPLPETVDLMQSLVFEYINDMVTEALDLNVSTTNNKLKTENMIYLIRNDPKKYARVEELLRMYEVLKKARSFGMPSVIKAKKSKFE